MPIIREGQLDIISRSAEQTMRLGARLGTLLESGDVICLSGDMGAGKTVFAGGIGKGWGAVPGLTSPTFSLVHVHRRSQDKLKLYHLDCYRLSNVLDAETVGLDDVLSGASVAIFEWPEHIEEALPQERLWIEFRILDNSQRNIVFDGVGARYKSLIETYRVQAFGR
ncbi:MAG: tRNA (adenosine(37)-N6)-threonylcarbamoyltransferase complex ATPase subunit type 1 TsaE [Anaerolineae bacterium]|nr:tRNA (adenosine(37)-N6)-threonylcarbamoyltransferase complex ATPase subunit type 1 TsaE [Anaerolineae bacterium]